MMQERILSWQQYLQVVTQYQRYVAFARQHLTKTIASSTFTYANTFQKGVYLLP